MAQEAGFWDDAEVISTYSRAQAIEDGVLADVDALFPGMAREAGIRYPVAMTGTAFGQYVAVPEGVTGQDPRGRMWDVLWMLRHAIKAAPPGQNEIIFRLHVRNDNRDRTPPLITLKAICGPGDTPEPIITILLPEED